jgi:hypothetical protein
MCLPLTLRLRISRSFLVNYEVVISSKLLSRFKNTGFDVTYYIALEPDSTFG